MYQELKRGSLLLVMMLLGCSIVFAQQRTVSGVILNQETREPLVGATVAVKGTDRQTATDEKGQFRIAASDESVLKITMVGFLYREIPVGKQNTFTINLDKDNKQMDEVVVVGYGTQKKSHLTGSVASIDVKKIEDIPVGNLSEALKGQIVGVNVVGGYSRPGEPANIVIRNPKFFSKDGTGTDVLYVIDDVIRTKTDFDMLDATEVESLSVLKDAAAAIYGIKGGNGVVIVKTKRGRAGQSQISYSGSVGISDAPYFPKMMSGYELATYLNDYNRANYSTPWAFDSTNTKMYMPDELEYFKTHEYNWLDQAWQQAVETRHAINITGGSDKATYFAGFTYQTQNSNFDGSRFNRYTFRASSDIKLTTGLKLGLSLSSNLSSKKNTFSKQGGESLDNDWKVLLNQPRFNPPFVNGLPAVQQDAENAGTNSINNYHYFAIHQSDNYTSSKGNGMNFLGSLSYEFPFLKGLRAAVNYNKNFNNSWGKQYGTWINEYQFSRAGTHNHLYGDSVVKVIRTNNGDRVRLNPTYTDDYQLNASVNFDRTFGRHQLGVLFGYEQNENYLEGVAASRDGVLIGGLDNQNFATGTDPLNSDGSSDQASTISEGGRLAYIGRLDYSFANKYLLQVQFRADASQNFAPENRWGYFPSVSAGWVASEEKFFNGILNTVNYLKIRASYGHLGTDNTKRYQWLRSYQLQSSRAAVFGGNTSRGLGVVTTLEMANRAVQWDNIDKLNGGIDARFLRNRLSASFDAYIDYRRDLLSTLSSSPSILIGTALPTENFGAANTFGYELSANWRDRIGKNWGYNVTTNFNWADNKILVSDVPKGDIGTYLDPTGKSDDMGYKGLHSLGIIRSQADVDAWLAKNPGYTIYGQQLKPGAIYFQDVRGPKDASGNYTGPDGKIDDNDLDFLTPKSDNHYGLGLNWGVSYKTLSLNVVMGMSWGGTNTVESAAIKKAEAYSNRPAFWANHWTPETPDAAYPAPLYTWSYDRPTDFWFRNSFTARVTTFNLSYTLPQRIINKARFNSARIYLVGTNPLNLYNAFDYKDGSNSSYDKFPQLRSFSLGVNLNL